MVQVNDRRGQEVKKEPSLVVPGMIEEVVIPEAPVYADINLKMMGERILIQPFPKSTKIGSIFTPEQREIDIDKGRVCGVGSDVKVVKVGDIICKIAGLGQSLVDDKGNQYIFLPENAAIAIDTRFTGKVDQCENEDCLQYREDTPNHCDGIASVLRCPKYKHHQEQLTSEVENGRSTPED